MSQEAKWIHLAQLGCVYQLQMVFFKTVISFQINHAKILVLCAMSPLKIMQRLSSDYWTYPDSFSVAFKPL